MKRVGLIDNLNDPVEFLVKRYAAASAADVMAATGGNTGNVAFVHGTQKLIDTSMTRLNWGLTKDVVRNSVDQLVVCCANQLGAHADLGEWADRLEGFGLPVTLVGLGAQSESSEQHPVLPPGTIKFLEVVKSLRFDGAPNIGVRGKFSSDVLSAIGTEAVVTGCPSLFINLSPNLGSSIFCSQAQAIKKVAVAAGNPWHGPSAFLEKLLVQIVDERGGDYIVQHPISVLQFTYGERSKISEKTAKRFLDVYGEKFDLDGLLEWYRTKACAFIDVGNWMRHLRRFDGAIGPRYHGIALAVQAGIPGCVITIDARTEELCKETAIKVLSLKEAGKLSTDDLVEAIKWSKTEAESFDLNRSQRAKRFADFFESNGLRAIPQLADVM